MSRFFFLHRRLWEKGSYEGFMAVWIFVVNARLDGLIPVHTIKISATPLRRQIKEKDQYFLPVISPSYLISLVSVCMLDVKHGEKRGFL